MAVAADECAVADVGSTVVATSRSWVIPNLCTGFLRCDFTEFFYTFEGLKALLDCLD